MQPFKDEKAICNKCKVDMQKKETRPENLDNNTQSLMVMFRIREVVIMECPCCGHRGMRF
jgi:hypothetical protein